MNSNLNSNLSLVSAYFTEGMHKLKINRVVDFDSNPLRLILCEVHCTE